MGILEKIAAAGVVGCGGAGFPTHKKLGGNIEYFIVNGAECEPLLRTDRYIMLHKAPQLVQAIQALKTELQIQNCVIALKHHYQEEIAALKAAIAAADAPIKIFEMESFYPAGDEQTIVHEVTGRTVPPAGLPISVGAVVNNIATVYAIFEATEGIPLTQKYLTVTGEVKHPIVLRVPVGTSYRYCLEQAGGTTSDQFFIVAGGPMMGKPVPQEALDHAVVTKTTSAIMVLPVDGYHAKVYETSVQHMLNRASSACIQCTSCTQLCPRNLLGHPLEPHRIMRKMAMGGPIQTMLDDPDIRNAALCCECGVCEVYACPMELQPRKINAMIKQELGKAGIRYQAPPNREWKESLDREFRKVPTERLAARAGVHKYYHYEIKELKCSEPERVTIPLKMHIGVSATAVVSVGDRVMTGDLIADIPENAMGAAVHASISGRVESVGEHIVLVKE